MPEQLLEANSSQKIYSAYINALDTLTRIAKSASQLKTNERGSVGDKAAVLLASYIHPELKPLSKELIKQEKQSEREVMLDKYAVKPVNDNTVDAHVIESHPLIKVIEAARAGIMEFGMQGIPRGKGEDIDSSIFANTTFMNAIGKMDRDITGNDSYTSESKIASVSNGSMRSRAEELMHADSVFGFSVDMLDAETVDWLKTLEHWFYYFITKQTPQSRMDSDEIRNDSDKLAQLGQSLYAYVERLNDLLKDTNVKNTLVDLDTALSKSRLEKIMDANGKTGLAKKSDIYQLVALLTKDGDTGDTKTASVKKNVYEGTINDYAMKILTEFADGNEEKLRMYHDAMIKIRSFMTKCKSDNAFSLTHNYWKFNDIIALLASNANDANNSAVTRNSSLAAELYNKLRTKNMAAVNTSDASRELYSHMSQGKQQANHFNINLAVGMILDSMQDDNENVNYSQALVSKSTVDNTPEMANSDIATGEVLNDTEDIPDNGADAKQQRAPEHPFTTAMKQLGIPDGGCNINDSSITFNVLDPNEQDVTGATVVPLAVIPLFATELTTPTGVEGTGNLYIVAVPLITYAAIAFGDDNIFSVDGFSRKTADVDGDISNIDATGIRGENKITESMSFTDEIVIAKVKETVERYFAEIAQSSDGVGNAISLRNQWTDAIMTSASLDIIKSAVLRYLSSRYENTLGDDAETTLKTVIDNAVGHVRRYIFNIMKGNSTIGIEAGNLTAHYATSRGVINTESAGRLRLTGGAEGTLTDDGRAVAVKAPAKVIGVHRSNEMDSYDITFGGEAKIIGTETVRSNELKTWKPSTLIEMPDSNTKQNQYSMWIGVQFISAFTDEGTLNTFGVPSETIEQGNAAYLSSNTGDSTTDSNATPSMKEFERSMHTMEGSAIEATIALDAATSDIPDSAKRDIIVLLDVAQKLNPQEMQSELDVAVIANKTPDVSASSLLIKVDDILQNKMVSILNPNEPDIANTESFETITKLIMYCMRARSAVNGNELFEKRVSECLNALVKPVADNEHIQVMDTSFSVNRSAMRNGTIELIPADDEDNMQKYVEYFATGAGQQVKSNVMKMAEALNNAIRANDTAEASAVATQALQAMNALRDAYADVMLSEVTNYGNRNNTANKYFDLLRKATSARTMDATCRIITAVQRVAKENPALNSHDLISVLKAMPAAIAVNDELRGTKTSNLMNDGIHGDSSRTRFFDSEFDPNSETAIQLLPDENGELDSHAGDMLSRQISEDSISAFDADRQSDYSGMTYSTMLNLVKSDAAGMHSGKGNFDIDSGISPEEFRVLAAALDSAHDTAERSADGVRSSNTAIRTYMNGKTIILDLAINSFYGFMSSSRELAKRDVLDEFASTVKYFDGIVTQCNDYSLKDVLIQMSRELNNLLISVNNQSADNENGTGEDIDYRTENLNIARRISTGIANVILNLETYNNVESDTTNPEGLAHFAANPPNSAADKYAYIGARHGARMGKAATTVSNEMMKKYVDANKAGLISSDDNYVDTLANLYDRLGMGDTMGFRGAIDPFSDMLNKISAKAQSPSRNIYNSEAQTDLGAALLYAIISDERRGNGYNQLAAILGSIVANDENAVGQHAISLPDTVVNGVSSKKSLDESDERVECYFTPSGRISSEPCARYETLKELNAALGPNSHASLGIDDGDDINVIARKLRTRIVYAQLENSSVLSELRRRDRDTNRPVFEEIVTKFISTMIVAAAKVMGDKDYVPLSVLYQCINTYSLTDAKQTSIERASNVLKTARDKSAVNELQRTAFGERYGEIPSINDSASSLDDARDDIAECIAGVLRRIQENNGTSAVIRRAALNYGFAGEGKSLSSILGSDTAEKVYDILRENVGLDQLVDMSEDDIRNYAESFTDSMFSEMTNSNGGTKLGNIAALIVDAATGNKEYDDALSEITGILGIADRNNRVAAKLLEMFYKRIGYNPHSEDDNGRITVNWVLPEDKYSGARIKNTANNIVNEAYRSSGSFRAAFDAKYPSEANELIKARRVMKGFSPSLGTEQVNNIGGMETLFNNVRSILNGDTYVDDADKRLRDMKFKVSMAEFNKYANDLRDALESLIKSSRDEVRAIVALRKNPDNRRMSNLAEKNRFGENADSIEGAGTSRRDYLELLNDNISTIKTALGSQAKNSVTLDDTVKQFLDNFCYLPGNMDNVSSDDLDEFLEKTNTASVNHDIENALLKVREVLSDTFARCKGCYCAGTIQSVGIASTARGMTSSIKLSFEDGRKLLNALSKINESPIRKVDDDTLPGIDYSVNGTPYETEKCILMLNDALDQYAETADDVNDIDNAGLQHSSNPNKTAAERAVAEHTGKNCFDINEFIKVLNNYSTMNRDLGIDTYGITSILLRTLRKNNVIKPSGRTGMIMCSKTIAGRHFNAEIPLTVITDIVNDVIGSTPLSGSANEWKAFANEFNVYTRSAIKKMDAAIQNETVKNQLWKLFNTVTSTRIPGKIKAAYESILAAIDQGQPEDKGRFLSGEISKTDPATGITLRCSGGKAKSIDDAFSKDGVSDICMPGRQDDLAKRETETPAAAEPDTEPANEQDDAEVDA